MKQLLGHTIHPLNKTLLSAMSNWLTICEVIYSDNISPKSILNMLAHEVTHNNRLMIVKRLLARYTKLSNKEIVNQFNKEVKQWEIQIKK